LLIVFAPAEGRSVNLIPTVDVKFVPQITIDFLQAGTGCSGKTIFLGEGERFAGTDEAD